MLVALCSTYREGPLALGAIRSALQATPHVIVFEGPAGSPLPNEADCPETAFPSSFGMGHSTYRDGAWKSDAAKRTAMIEHCRKYRKYDDTVWGVWIDGDEILCNPEYLTDHLNQLDWTNDPDEPWMGWPIKLVELDGSVTVCRGKVVRVDLIDSYSVSSSVFKNALGHLHGEGNVPLKASEYWAPFERLAREYPEQADRVVLSPPLPCEPFLLHRSALRHPARAGLRLHEQEAVELEKAKLRDG